jgi:hypothetical protein
VKSRWQDGRHSAGGRGGRDHRAGGRSLAGGAGDHGPYVPYPAPANFANSIAPSSQGMSLSLSYDAREDDLLTNPTPVATLPASRGLDTGLREHWSPHERHAHAD